MVESYRATIEWVGKAALGTILLAAASRPGCTANLTETGDEAKLVIIVQDDSIPVSYTHLTLPTNSRV